MSRKKAVICDDDRTMVNIVQHILKLEQFEVFTSNNGKDGLAQINTVTPQLVILDINMPEKDGFSVLTDLSDEQKNNTYIIILSSHENKEIHEKALNLGAREVLVKPFTPINLKTKIHNLDSQGQL